METKFENIFTDFETFTKTFPKLNEPRLFSFAFRFEKSDWLSIINKIIASYSDVSFFKTANNQLTIIGINSALNLQSSDANNFTSISDSFNHWKINFTNNWNEIHKTTAPFIFCSARFDVNNSSKLWEEFDPLRIHVSEFILEFNSNVAYVYYNFILEKNSEVKVFSTKLSKFLEKLFEPINGSEDSSPNLNSIKFDDKESFSDWNELFNKVLKSLEDGDLNKLVLSRTFNIKIENQINWKILLARLNKRFPECYLFLIKKNNSIFFGSSPEMFLKVSGNTAEVESVAGSAARNKKIEADNELEKFLKTSEKNHQEHLIVSNFITDVLIKYSDNVHILEKKQIRKLDNIQHLITRISAELNSEDDLFRLIDSLFPTPAVCGIPKEKAMNLIRQLEVHDRGLYSGLVGFFDFKNSCELAVAIRSALVKENQVTAFAGAGLVKGSDPKEEFLEINLKLNTILSLFTDENKS
jgi:menaquinone-specific isochorismate synthase